MAQSQRQPLRVASGWFAAALARLGPLAGLAAVWLLFAALKGPDFVRWDNQRLMLLQTAVVGTAAIGATLIIIAGGIDLSVGSTIALGTVVIAMLLRAGVDPLWAGLGGVGAAALSGLAIGSLVIGHVGRVAALPVAFAVFWTVRLAALRWGGEHWTIAPWPFDLFAAAAAFLAVLAVDRWLLKRVPLSPFIVTLGLWGAWRGAAKGIAGNQAVYPDHATWLDRLMQLESDGLGSVLPFGVWLLLGLAVLAALILHYTRFGRHVYAVGSNESAARLCGVGVERTKLLVYAFAGICAGIAGVLQFSFLSMGDPTTADGYELKVIAAVVIGGASLSGGEGGILGTLVGAFLMTVVDNGCTKLGLDNWVQEIVSGAIIVSAVVLDRLRARSRTT
ncbi:MAG: ABC transporter permease [Planctomycetes bacterium]|nr:ABC transporter permease [Planctomycetota bacterium]